MKTGIRRKLLTEVQKTVEEHNMIKGAKKIVIAFSSGPDSVCLLDVLSTLYGDKIDFCLVYINHGLRPQKYLSGEEELTRKYASEYNLRYKIINLKIKKTKIGIEAAARELRLNALASYMKKIKAQRIALGHNLDDVIETFFMNLVRGSGARGLSSIPAVRLPFVRPLINLEKKDILAYVKTKRLRYSLDETNRMLNYRRNLLRHKVIPELTKINPDIHETIKRELDILKQDNMLLEKQAEKVYKAACSSESNHVLLDIRKIMRYNPAVVNRVVMKAIKDLHGCLDGFESKHLRAIVGLMDKESGKRISLPKRLCAQREYDKIVIGTVKPLRSTKIPVDTENDLLIAGHYTVRTKTVSSFDLRRRKPDCEVFDLDQIEPPLFIRSKRTGDYIDTKIGKKRFKKLYHEFKIPLRKRSKIMMLCDQKGILLIFGIARAFRGFINKKTKKIMVVEFEHNN